MDLKEIGDRIVKCHQEIDLRQYAEDHSTARGLLSIGYGLLAIATVIDNTLNKGEDDE